MSEQPGDVPHDVRQCIEAARAAGDRIVFTNGCFDLLHPGHVQSLRRARALGDVLVVGLNSDDSVRRLKGRGRPVMPATARAEVLLELRSVDHVIVFDAPTPVEVLRELRPDVYVKGADWRGKPLAEADLVRELGGTVAFIDLVTGYSTTNIIEAIRGVPSA